MDVDASTSQIGGDPEPDISARLKLGGQGPSASSMRGAFETRVRAGSNWLRDSAHAIAQGLSESVVDTLRPPRRFRSDDMEARFQAEYRLSGLALSTWGGIVGALILVALAIEASASGYPLAASSGELCVFAALLLALSAMSLFSRNGAIHRYRYVEAVSTAACVAFLSAILIGLITMATETGVSCTLPAIFLGLFVIYGYLRAPLTVVLCVCLAGSVVYYIAARTYDLQLAGSHGLLAIYLVAWNVFGLVLAMRRERRERDLFEVRQRLLDAVARQSETARHVVQAFDTEVRLIEALNHDVRSPMQVVALQLQRIRESVDTNPDQAREHISQAETSIARVCEVVDSVLELAHAERDSSAVELRPVEVCGLLRQVASETAPGGERSVPIQLVCPPHPVHVRSNHASLLRIVSNLVGNAVKYTAAMGGAAKHAAVQIRLCVDREYATIEVIDSGSGIAPAYHEAIFNPLMRARHEGIRSPEARGIGLRIVKKLIERMHDHGIKLEFDIGRGSTFTVSMPICEASQSLWNVDHTRREGPGSAASTELDLHGMVVFLVEDEDNVREAVADMLRDSGVIVVEAQDPRELGLDRLDTERGIDVVVSDYMFGGTAHGFDVIRAVRDHTGWRVPALVTSGNSDPKGILGRCDDATQFLRKPFSMHDLRRWLHEQKTLLERGAHE